jgi:ATP-dependent Clp protease ATP-binding subunit ClpA
LDAVDFSVEVASAISRAATEARDRGADRVRVVDVLAALLASEDARASKVVAAVSSKLRESVQLAAMTQPGNKAQYASDQPVPLSDDLQSVMRELRCRQGAGSVQSTDLLLALAQQPAAAELLRKCGVQLADLETACSYDDGVDPEPAARAASGESDGRADWPVAARQVPAR